MSIDARLMSDLDERLSHINLVKGVRLFYLHQFSNHDLARSVRSLGHCAKEERKYIKKTYRTVKFQTVIRGLRIQRDRLHCVQSADWVKRDQLLREIGQNVLGL
jgi:hypothetical protein